MFDSFASRTFQTGLTADENTGSGEGGKGLGSFFGGISDYMPCACCARFHGAATAVDGPFNAYLNADDRGGYGDNGKPSLTPGDAGAQITRTGLSWATGLGQPAVVTYSFRDTATTMPSDTSGFSRFTSQQIAAAELAFAAWADVANITFTRVNDAGSQYSNNATIVLGNYASGQSGAAAFAYLPGNSAAGFNAGDVWINSSLSYNANPVMLAYGQQVLLHEIGHAIGLSHPAAYNAAPGVSIVYGVDAIYYEDSRQYTVMSYFSETNTSGYFANRYASAPLMDDIAAAQRLYGANMTTRTGDTVYGFNSNAGRSWYSATSASSALVFSVWDAGGIDTFDFSGFFQDSIIDLRQGAFSNVGGLIGNVSIAMGVTIENVIGGTGNDQIRGNSADNVITGNGGNDTIDGGLGSDTVVFSGARSAYTITWNGQVGTISGPGGVVTVRNVEFLKFSDQTIAAAPTGGLLVSGDATNDTMNGTAFADTMGGLGGHDTLNGLGGDDILDGGSGNDILNGGDGDDILIGGLGDDALNGGAGFDIADYSGAREGVTVNLATGQASGGAGNDTLTGIEGVNGTAFNDILTGDAGDNILRGGGGIDTLNGGDGADQLFAGDPGQAGGAPDLIKAQTTANSGIFSAVSLNGHFDLMENKDIADSSTIPHATVQAVAHGGMEYYAVTVVAGDKVVFDIDNAAFDSTLRLFDANGVELAQNDDSAADGGSDTDSGLTYTFATAGVYYIQVAAWSSNVGSTFNSKAPPAGARYTLHVSVPSAPVVPLILLGSTLNGEGGADRLEGGVGADTLNGGDDNDTLIGGAGDDTLDGGAGMDTAVFSGPRSAYTVTVNPAGVVTVSGPDGVDTLRSVERLQFSNGVYDWLGNPLTNVINGTNGDDVLVGTAGGDVINGLGGNDVITGGTGNDTIDGGDGFDVAVFSGSFADYSVHTQDGVTTVTGPDGTDTLTNIEHLRFADGTLIVGAGGGQYFEGTPGADTIHGTAFNDVMIGGAGDDVLIGNAGDDVLRGGAGNDTLNGGAGHDVADYSGAAAGVFVRLDRGQAVDDGDGGTDVLIDIEELVGSAFDDILFGGSGNDVLRGGAGRDVILGLDGDDIIHGGADTGNELYGGRGDDTYVVENADDTIVEWEGEGNDTVLTALSRLNLAANVENLIYIGTGDFEGHGNSGDNVLRGGSGRNFLLGFDGDDTIYAGSGSNELYGGRGNDRYVVRSSDTIIEGVGEGIDTVVSLSNHYTLGANLENLEFGGTGNFDGTGNALDNLITGGAGDDVLRGGGGNDVIDGGLGRDEVHFRGAQAEYTVTAEGAGYRIVDSVAGRDGSTLVTNVDALRFVTGNTVMELSQPVAGAVIKEQGPEVSPLLDDDAFVLPGLYEGKGADAGPHVLPGVFDGDAGMIDFGMARYGPANLFDNSLVVVESYGLQPLIDDHHVPTGANDPWW